MRRPGKKRMSLDLPPQRLEVTVDMRNGSGQSDADSQLAGNNTLDRVEFL